MENVFKFLFDRELSDDESEAQKKQSKDYRASGAGGFLPSDPNYDPQMRLKQRLKLLFPHLPVTPGLPPRLQDEE